MKDHQDMLIKSAGLLATTLVVVAISAWLVTSREEKIPQALVSTTGSASASSGKSTAPSVSVPLFHEEDASLERADENSVQTMQKTLTNSTLSQAEKVVHADQLIKVGSPEAVQKLLGMIISEPDEGIRTSLAEALRNLSNPEGTEALVSALAATRDPQVIDSVLDAVERMADPEAVQFLLELYRESPSVHGQHRAVARALGSIRNPEAARALGNVVRSAPEPGLVEAAARSLSKIGSPAAVSGLISAFDNPWAQDPAMRTSLLAMVARVQDEASESYRNSLLTQDELPQDVRAALTANGNLGTGRIQTTRKRNQF